MELLIVHVDDLVKIKKEFKNSKKQEVQDMPTEIN